MPEGKLFLLAVPKALALHYRRNGSIICQTMKTQNIQTEYDEQHSSVEARDKLQERRWNTDHHG